MKRRKSGRWMVRHDEAGARIAYQNGLWVETTLADALTEAAIATPDRILLIDGEFKLTAKMLHDQAIALAAKLQSQMARGSVVSFILPNWHEAAVIYMATTISGMVVNPILPSLRDHDLRFILADADTRMVFAPEQFRGFNYAEMLHRVCREMRNPPQVVIVRSEARANLSFECLGETDTDFEPVTLDADDVQMVMYTSGTTGRPKGVLHTHNSIHALLMQIGKHWRVDAGDRFLVPSPISHIGGSIYAFEAPLLLGTSAVLMDKWNAADAIPLMLSHKITHMAGATPFLQQLLLAAEQAQSHLPDLKVFICGGASVPPSLIEQANAYFDQARVSRVYGSTEVPVTTIGALEKRGMTEAAHTDGKPGIAEVILADNDEIRARGAQMLVGYVHPEDEALAFDEEGFYRTGDQGRLTESGALVVTGRIKDLIIRNGENIAPKEIEDLLLSHRAVGEIAIVGVPDERTGEKACAVIVPQSAERPSIAELADFLAGFGVAKFKYPELVEYREALPKNEAGKVLKNVLRDALSKN